MGRDTRASPLPVDFNFTLKQDALRVCMVHDQSVLYNSLSVWRAHTNFPSTTVVPRQYAAYNGKVVCAVCEERNKIFFKTDRVDGPWAVLGWKLLSTRRDASPPHPVHDDGDGGVVAERFGTVLNGHNNDNTPVTHWTFVRAYRTSLRCGVRVWTRAPELCRWLSGRVCTYGQPAATTRATAAVTPRAADAHNRWTVVHTHTHTSRRRLNVVYTRPPRRRHIVCRRSLNYATFSIRFSKSVRRNSTAGLRRYLLLHPSAAVTTVRAVCEMKK